MGNFNNVLYQNRLIYSLSKQINQIANQAIVGDVNILSDLTMHICNFLTDRRLAHLYNYMYSRAKSPEYIDNRVRRTRLSEAPMCKVLHAIVEVSSSMVLSVGAG